MDLSSTNKSPIENDLVTQPGEVSETRVIHCCVCSGPLNLGPVFQCIHEHNTCSKCHDDGPKKCIVCSLPVTQQSLSVETIIESMNVPSILELCSCPQAGCNFRANYSDFASHFNKTHLLLIRPFIYGMMYGTVIRRDEETIIFRELNDGILFIMKNKFERMGNTLSFYHFAPTTLNMKFSFQLMARTQLGQSYYLGDSNVQNIQDARSSKFILIPHDFVQPPECLTLEILITKIGVA